MSKPSADDRAPLDWLDFSGEENERPHLSTAKCIVHLVDQYWCKHVRQGMCVRCQKDRVRDVDARLQDFVAAAEAAARAEGEASGLEQAAELCKTISEGDGMAFAEMIRALRRRRSAI